jgi:hypothetical protein
MVTIERFEEGGSRSEAKSEIFSLELVVEVKTQVAFEKIMKFTTSVVFYICNLNSAI